MTDIESTPAQSAAMRFPCELDIKVFAHADSRLELRIRELLSVHLRVDQIIDVSVKQSRGGRYHSLSCKVNADTREQIDQVYNHLGRDDSVLMLL